ncbi:MAG: biopolymer transporter ExbD [Schleiferiaceae bacterium]|jgi:biopolymer transport protein ExbD|nr:biopolymer transporter ExbD [Flavobacteriaceae bacterium]MDP4616277.1 biopolymer transporter ExbD [Schleiferiaceae bacterium]MDP4759429.1 biopolymer transporter ExbD [Schleiferiaceae bacterium]MDP4767677.1 biopolymer transporter ExbD [Schleiferiaceae bacterium]MDP4876704.1 biopolymer transporter ExbD [Schleiferiaceae bacterium]
MARNKRAIPEINAGSMADIAFLLLIFYLVTTTMDTDKGINRKLPPWDEELVEDPPPIKERNIFTVLVNSNDQLLVEDEYLEISQLREKAMEFIDNNGDGSCTYCKGFKVSTSSDNPDKAVISLQNDRGTSYGMYVKVQNELVAAYEDLREKYAEEEYGKSYRGMDEEEDKDLLSEIKKAYPQKISEAEPLNIGG